MSGAIQGRCHCGGVRFEITGTPGPMGHCHCSRCRKSCGAAFHTPVLVRGRYFRWIAGRELVLSYQPEPPFELVRDSCSICGCYLGEVASSGAGTSSLEPDWMIVSAAILEGDLGRAPSGHEWVAEAVAWHRFCDGLPCFAAGFPPPEVWRDEARLRAAAVAPPVFVGERAPARPIFGSCLCGDVRYRVDGPLSEIVNCHCIDCRRCQGAEFATNASLAIEDLRLLSGESSLQAYESSPGNRRSFCIQCGAPVFAHGVGGDSVRVRMGSLDADPGFDPGAHVWASQGVAWQALDDGLPVVQRGPSAAGEGA
jgi:hypothetical protein